MAGPIRIAILADTAQATRKLSAFTRDLKTSSSKTEKFNKVGLAAGAALGAGLTIAAKAAVDFAKKAALDQQGAARLAQTLRNSTGATKEQTAAVEDWITAQGKAVGIADDDLRPALSKLAVATGSVAKAQKLAKLAMDVSTGSGKSLESVSTALAKAQNGNLSGLGRLGVATKDAAGETKSLKDITQDLADTYAGAAAKNAETAAGKQQILSVQMGELQEKIGAGLLPVMEKLTEVGLKVVDWISKNSKVVVPLVAIIGTLVVGIVAVTAATAAFNTVLALNPIGLVVIAVAALVIGLVILYKRSETARKVMQVAFAGIQIYFKTLWNIVGPILKLWIAEIKLVGAAATWLWDHAFRPALAFIVKGIAVLIAVWASMLHALGHVPGFEWADKAGDALQAAADKANRLASAIDNIHDKTVNIYVVTHHAGRPGTTDPDLITQGGNPRTPTKPSKTVIINVTAPVGSDPYTIGEGLKFYLDAFENAG